MNDNSIIIYLFSATFLLVLIYGFVQLYKVRKAKREGTRSAISQRETGTTAATTGQTGSNSTAPKR